MVYRKKIKEIDFTLFAEIAKTKQLAIFDFISPEKLDLYYSNMYSERFESNVLMNNIISDVAEIVIGFYATKWDSILAYITSSIPVLKNYGEKITETITDNGTDNNTRESVEKVSAYNDENFVNDNQNTDTYTGTTTNSKERTQIVESLNASELDKIILYLQSNYVYDTIFTDVNEMLTLSVFEF